MRCIMIPENPEMLYSYINLKLRDNYSSLDDLCDDLDISKSDIVDKLAKAGYKYDEINNKFI